MSARDALQQGYFPLNASPAVHITRVPFANTLGLVWEGGDAAGARVKLPFSSAAATADKHAVDSMAILALIDHACSAAVFLALPCPTLVATLDLRCEFAAASEPGEDVLCTAQTQYLAQGFALVRASAANKGSGRQLAYASSAYALGAHPGMKGKEAAAQALQNVAVGHEHHDGFQQMLGLQRFGGAFRMPFDERLIGAVSLPSVHGGATAAALALAAGGHAEAAIEPAGPWRPLTLSVHYLRAVRAEPLLLEPVLRKPGSGSCVVGVAASQGGTEKNVALAECLLVRANSEPSARATESLR